ncbi:MAG TPA: L,D-transpeptidase [Methylomirabilota bacterium]|nr:L,D-transpeptidase [Methylomirabilota bacterium]
MSKKSHPKKKSLSKTRAKKTNFFSFFKKFVVAVFVGCLFFIGTTIILQKKAQAVPCANSKSCVSDLSEKIENNATGTFAGRTVTAPTIDPNAKSTHLVLGDNTKREDKHIYVDLSTQTLYAYQGNNLFMKTLVATGKWGKTPVGNFHIWEKLVSTRMAGGEGADAYDLPNVPYVMYFYHDFGLHGAYWHDNFGHTMSHGCVNMRQVDAKQLYEWADAPSGDTPGTAVSVCNQVTGNRQCVQNNPIQ